MLVDYDQYVHLQKRFRELISEAFAVTQVFPRFKVPQGYELKVEHYAIQKGLSAQGAGRTIKAEPYAGVLLSGATIVSERWPNDGYPLPSSPYV